MLQVGLFTLDEKFPPWSKAKTKSWVRYLCNQLGLIQGFVNFIFTSSHQHNLLNHKYHQSLDETDVLTFDLNEDPKVTQAEIYLNMRMIMENAPKFNDSGSGELCRVMIHGILHLAGYNDGSEEEKTRMRDLETHWITELKETPSFPSDLA